VLGVILGKIAEQTFAQAIRMMHYDRLAYFQRPISAVLLTLGILTLVVNIYRAIRGTGHQVTTVT
jgi:TctA family transporter